MKYILDTDVVIDHLRGKKPIGADVLADAVISIITLGELIHGANKSDESKGALSKLSREITKLGLKVENLDEQIIYEFGNIKAELELCGERLEDFDLLIAATAIVGGLTLVTRNLKHFRRINGLKLYKMEIS